MLYTKDQATEKLPTSLAYNEKSQSPPCTSSRFYVSPTNGNVFTPNATSTTTVRMEIPTGTYATHLNTQETALAVTVNNTTGQALTIDSSGLSLIDSIDCYYGSVLLSSISQYDLFAQLMVDFTGGNSYHYAKGMADIAYTASGDVTATVNQANVNTALNNTVTAAIASLNGRNGRVIANNASDTFIIPIMNLVGSLAMKCLPIGELKGDAIRLEIKMAGFLDYGTFPTSAPTSGISLSNIKLWLTVINLDGETHGALSKQLGGIFHVPSFDVECYRSSISQNTGRFTYVIPVKVSSLTTVIIALRENAVFGAYNQRSLSRTKSTLSNYRFRIGSTTVPSSEIDCTGSAAECRMEVIRAFNQLNVPVADSYISNAIYNLGAATANAVGAYGGFCFALNLSALGSADVLSDGRQVRNENIVVDITFAGNNVPLQMDSFCIHEKLYVIESGVMSYKN